MLNVRKLRKDFPIFKRKFHGKPLCYLDSTATSQKPVQVMRAVTEFYSKYCANVHRGIYALSVEATAKYDEAREKVREFVKAPEVKEIIFTRNATEALNLLAYSWGFENLKPGDEVVTTVMEHHANLVPWQMFQQRGVALKFIDIDAEGRLDMQSAAQVITRKTKLVTAVHASNMLGTVNDVRQLARMAHDAGALMAVDGAQSVPHMPVDVRGLECDFLAFSGHKMLAPDGIGVLWGRKELLERMKPFLYGGDMIRTVSLHEATWNELPTKFEAGTPNASGTIGLGAAIDYLEKIGMHRVHEHERELAKYAMKRLGEIDEVSIYGPKKAEERVATLSFSVEGLHPHDVAQVLDAEGIAVRSGHHCTMPLHKKLGMAATTRASFYLYNDRKDVDRLAKGVEKAVKVLS
ncbi:MAG: cysteine desulfurase [Candidatus Micrarchaeia archaeon]|jgi:cysteine desulfurase/selenocysteine lyase